MRWLLAGAAFGAAVGCGLVVWLCVLQDPVAKVARGDPDYGFYLLIQFAVWTPLGAFAGLLPGGLLALLTRSGEPADGQPAPHS